MLSLPEETIINICDELTDKGKILFTSTSFNMNKLKDKLIYRDNWRLDVINHLPYFDNFENIDIEWNHTRFPKRTKYIHHISRVTCIPPNVTHLTFGDHFIFSQHNSLIPISVTYLTFGHYFNQPIQNIPESVTHLTFGHYFNQPIKGNISPFVTHLTFGKDFNQEIDLESLPKITFFTTL